MANKTRDDRDIYLPTAEYPAVRGNDSTDAASASALSDQTMALDELVRAATARHATPFAPATDFAAERPAPEPSWSQQHEVGGATLTGVELPATAAVPFAARAEPAPPPPRRQASAPARPQPHFNPSPAAPARLGAHRQSPPPPDLMVPRALLREVDEALGKQSPAYPAFEDEPATDPHEPPPASVGLVAHSVIRLLWHDAACVDHARSMAQWQPLLMELELRRLEAGSDEDDDAQAGSADHAIRHVTQILSLAKPAAIDSLQTRLYAAVNEHGRLSPPLVLLAGDVVLPFDARKRLNVTLACASPFAAAAPALAEAVKSARDTLELTGVHAPAEMIVRLTQRIETAFEQGSRSVVSARYLRDNVDRILLEQRAYRERRVFGAPHLLAHLSQGVAEDGAQPPPLYLPTSLADQLPLMQRFSARLLAEIDSRQDDFEQHPIALRAVAIARSLDPVQPS